MLAYDGHEALRLFENENPDVILLDVMMPRKDGFEACRELRKTSNVPVIKITARGEDFEKIMGLDIGADDKTENVFEFDTLSANVCAWTVCYLVLASNDVTTFCENRQFGSSSCY